MKKAFKFKENKFRKQKNNNYLISKTNINFKKSKIANLRKLKKQKNLSINKIKK